MGMEQTLDSDNSSPIGQLGPTARTTSIVTSSNPSSVPYSGRSNLALCIDEDGVEEWSSNSPDDGNARGQMTKSIHGPRKAEPNAPEKSSIRYAPSTRDQTVTGARKPRRGTTSHNIFSCVVM